MYLWRYGKDAPTQRTDCDGRQKSKRCAGIRGAPQPLTALCTVFARPDPPP